MELSETNIFLKTAKLYNKMNGDVCKLKESLNIPNTTFNRYLNRANDLGLIIYDKSKSVILGNKKAQERRYQNNAKPIMCVENGYVFGTQTILANNSLNVFGKKISVGSVCNAVNHNKTIFGLKLIHITRKEFNDIKLSSPDKAYGDFFNSLKDGNEVA